MSSSSEVGGILDAKHIIGAPMVSEPLNLYLLFFLIICTSDEFTVRKQTFSSKDEENDYQGCLLLRAL